MNQLSFDFAKTEVADLDIRCREAFERGRFHPTTPFEMLHLIQTHFEYHRLSELRREARERIAKYEAQVKESANDPANDIDRAEERA